MKNYLAIALILMLSGTQSSQAQVSENTKLFKDVMALDSHLFEEGFNQCKLDVMDKYVSQDLEFFHDKSGIQNRRQFLEAVKKNICSHPDEKPIRTLLAGSSQVFALENNGVLYGAIQMGAHRFHTQGADPAVAGYTDAKFTHLWLIRDGQWKLKNSLSYDHQHRDGKTAITFSIKRTLMHPLKVFELTVASLTFGLYLKQ